MSAQPNYPVGYLDPAVTLRMRVAEGLCAIAESLAMAGKMRRARRCMAAVRRILDEIARIAALSGEGSAAAQDLRTHLEELQHRARNAETVLRLIE